MFLKRPKLMERGHFKLCKILKVSFERKEAETVITRTIAKKGVQIRSGYQ